MRGDDIAIVKQLQCVERHFFSFGGKSGDEVGADRRVRPRGLDPLDRAHGIGAAVAALHALEDQIVARLQRKMEMRHQPRLARDQFEQGVVDLDAVERRQAQSLEPRLGGQEALAQSPETALVIGDVDAGEDDLLRAAVDLPGNRIADRFERQGTAWSARPPDRAEGAAMVAAGLDRDEALDLVPAARPALAS